ncbi:MAG: TolC family protein, partial [Myxococcales bacterium]|nr:TolC family protein [Myxococcales bacterium]
MRHPTLVGLVALTLLAGCAARYEEALRRDLARTGSTLRMDPSDDETPDVDGSLASYVALAMTRSPELRERYERWRAETLRIARARALPEPTIAYGFFALPVQTRVGPQRHRLSASQSFPWPTRLTAAADAQSARARAAQLRFEARALDVAARVADAWWRLWVIERVAAVWREQLELLGGVAESVRGRVETDQATLADVAQVDLTRSRLDDA